MTSSPLFWTFGKSFDSVPTPQTDGNFGRNSFAIVMFNFLQILCPSYLPMPLQGHYPMFSKSCQDLNTKKWILPNWQIFFVHLLAFFFSLLGNFLFFCTSFAHMKPTCQAWRQNPLQCAVSLGYSWQRRLDFIFFLPTKNISFIASVRFIEL